METPIENVSSKLLKLMGVMRQSVFRRCATGSSARTPRINVSPLLQCSSSSRQTKFHTHMSRKSRLRSSMFDGTPSLSFCPLHHWSSWFEKDQSKLVKVSQGGEAEEGAHRLRLRWAPSRTRARDLISHFQLCPRVMDRK